jgi:hypothetical protein
MTHKITKEQCDGFIDDLVNLYEKHFTGKNNAQVAQLLMWGTVQSYDALMTAYPPELDEPFKDFLKGFLEKAYIAHLEIMKQGSYKGRDNG